MELVLRPEPDEPTRRAVAAALASLPASPHDVYASRWRLAGLAENVVSGLGREADGALETYPASPRNSRGVTRA